MTGKHGAAGLGASRGCRAARWWGWARQHSQPLRLQASSPGSTAENGRLCSLHPSGSCTSSIFRAEAKAIRVQVMQIPRRPPKGFETWPLFFDEFSSIFTIVKLAEKVGRKKLDVQISWLQRLPQHPSTAGLPRWGPPNRCQDLSPRCPPCFPEPLPTCPTTAGILRAISQMYLFGLNFTGVRSSSA